MEEFESHHLPQAVAALANFPMQMLLMAGDLLQQRQKQQHAGASMLLDMQFEVSCVS